MVERYLKGYFIKIRLQILKESRPQVCMGFHDFILINGKAGGFLQDEVADSDLAYIVKHCSHPKDILLFLHCFQSDASSPCPFLIYLYRVGTHAVYMSACLLWIP